MTMGPTNRRILIVEDEMMIALMLESMLTDLGCEIPVTAVTTTEALAIIETDARIFDAATVDLNLHGTNSADVMAALELRGIPFIITTGYDDPASLGGFTGPILFKPFSAADLERALASLPSGPTSVKAGPEYRG